MNFKIFSPQDFPAYLPKLNLLYDDLFSGGKGFRSKLVQIVADPLALPLETQNLLCQTIEFIHNASLLHDDLVDRSQLRRGKEAAWHKYTPEYAVLAGDYLLARVMVNLSQFGNIQLVQFTSETISDLLEGEWLQDSVVGDFFVSLEQLDRIHHLKTASLFRWCLRAPLMAQNNFDSELHKNLNEMGTILGQLFQRSDDLLDYNIRNEEGKALLGDLKSGYLNSFGSFLIKDFDRSTINQFIKSTSMDDIFKCYSVDVVQGQNIFNQKVEQFDEINTKLINLYKHHLNELDQKMKSPELLKSLGVLTDVLYWRRKPSH